MGKSRKYGRKVKTMRKKNSKSRRRGGCGCNKKRGGNHEDMSKSILTYVTTRLDN
jgi:hypothetical protein